MKQILAEQAPEEALAWLTARIARTPSNGELLQGELRVLLDVLQSHRHPEVGEWAIRGLGFLGPEAASSIPLLLEALGTEELALIASTTLYEVGFDDVEPLLERLHSVDPQFRAGAALALGLLGTDGPRVVPALLCRLEDSFSHVRLAALFALEKLGPWGHATAPQLLSLVHDSDAKVAGDAAWCLARHLPVADVRNVLLPMVRDPRPELRCGALRGLGSIAYDPVVEPVLVASLGDSEAIVRHTAIMALRKIREPEEKTVRAIAEHLKDQHPDTDVSYVALVSLALLGPKAAPAVADLCDALRDPHYKHRKGVPLALKRIGLASPEVIEALRLTMREPGLEATAARHALRELGVPSE